VVDGSIREGDVELGQAFVIAPHHFLEVRRPGLRRADVKEYSRWSMGHPPMVEALRGLPAHPECPGSVRPPRATAPCPSEDFP
jgi:hypothetical protein